MEKTSIKDSVNKFIDPDCNKQLSRETTFDLCFNYFHRYRGALTDDIEKSCCILWSYLASWGMLRGSTLLLQKNPAYLTDLIKFIDSDECKDIFDVDVDSYDNGGIEKIMKVYSEIEKILSKNKEERKPTPTLITKIMLGVFGCVPAYDQYFCNAFKKIKPRRGFSSYRVDTETLTAISEFYKENRDEINTLADTTPTIDIFSDGTQPTQYKYTKAKIIDMYGFKKGLTNKPY